MSKRRMTDQQRQAASDRMKKMNAARRAAQEQIEGMEAEAEAAPAVAVLEKPARDPEIQAILDTMSPERKAKLAQIQATTLATREAQEALARHAQEQAQAGQPGPTPPGRIGSREVMLIVKTDGTMVSQYGPCICGAPKREWHPICATPKTENENV